MKAFLLDTHVFWWMDSDPNKLAVQALEILDDPSNEVFLSTASIWEMQIKRQLGKLTLSISLFELIDSQIKTNRIKILDIKLQHILNLELLPELHKDPFDRMLISQSIFEKIPLITHDQSIQKYSGDFLW